MISDKPERGTGMLAMFVDLETQWHEEFRVWLQKDMFRARLEIGFHACASYDLIRGSALSQGEPQQFLTIYEMANVGGLYGEPYQGLRRVRDPRDAAFHERFQNADRYTLSWTGPEVAGGDPGFAPVVYVDRFNLPPEDAQEFNIWFVSSYLPACDDLDGLERVRRYAAIEGAPGAYVFHEFNTEAALESNQWQDLRGNDMWSRVQTHPGGSAAYSRVISAVL